MWIEMKPQHKYMMWQEANYKNCMYKREYIRKWKIKLNQNKLYQKSYYVYVFLYIYENV